MNQTEAQRQQQQLLKVGSSLLLVICLVCCGSASENERRVRLGERPVAEIRLLGGREYVELEPGEALGSVVDLSVFGGFEPGMTFVDAERTYGPPESVRTRHANTYHSYPVEGARVELARLLIESEGPAVTKWELKAFPEAQRPLTRFVEPSVMQQLEHASSAVTIMESGDGESASFQIEDGAVVWIYWSGPDHGLSQ